MHGYYDSMLILIRGIMSTTLKDDENIFKGYVTGCLRIAHQSIFTGVNNFDCYGLNDTPYARFIGLTKDETARLLKDCGMENRLPDVISWYDGYSFAGKEMLCPWSVLNFLCDALRTADPAVWTCARMRSMRADRKYSTRWCAIRRSCARRSPHGRLERHKYWQ